MVVVVLMAVVVSFVNYRGFGRENQTAELPLVLRAIDADFLVNDFYTNTGSEFGPRYLYSHIIASITNKEMLPLTSFLLTLLINISIALITFFIALELYNRMLLSGLLASGFVLSIHTFKLGYSPVIYANHLLSCNLAVPFIFYSFYAALRGHPIRWALASGIAICVHPAFGAESGGISFLLMVFSGIIKDGGRGISGIKNYLRKNVWNVFAAVSFFTLCFLIQVIPYLSLERIETSQFLFIETFLRHPHHSVPSFFPKFDFILGFLFMGAVGMAWWWWYKKKNPPKYLSLTFPFICLMIFCFCLLGYIFVEILPLRSFAIARPFRLLFLVKWWGLIAAAGFISYQYKSFNSSKLRKIQTLILLLSMWNPISMAISFFFAFKEKSVFSTTQKPIKWNRFVNILVIVLLGSFFLIPGIPHSTYFLFVWVFYLFYFRIYPQFFSYFFRGVLLFLIVLSFFYYSSSSIFPDSLQRLLRKVMPEIRASDLYTLELEVGRFANKSTPKDAIFLTPPLFGKFRLFAPRAIVVDWKAFPFQDLAMKEWQKRLFDCYGQPAATGHWARSELKRNYKNINDKKILNLQKKYTFSYAVLYLSTSTDFPIIYQNQKYKLVMVK
jgi:hypothetical protein